MPEDFTEVLASLKPQPDFPTPFQESEFTHRIHLLVLQAGLDGTLDAVRMRDKQISPGQLAGIMSRSAINELLNK
jgi:hypothetical protein